MIIPPELEHCWYQFNDGFRLCVQDTGNDLLSGEK
jgi:hypothetical protein